MKIGIDIGGSHIAIGVINENGLILKQVNKRITAVEKQNIEYFITNYIIENTLELCNKYEITQIGIAMPGDFENGIIITSGNVGIKNYNILEELHKKINLPITIRNDAKCAAIAEKTYGCLKETKRSLFLTLGTGIGGAFLLNDKLEQGEKRAGYEFGHMVIYKNGEPCVCGRKGCLERYASMKVFKNNLRKILNLDENTRGEELLEILRSNNPSNENYEKINNLIEEYIENLSIGLINLINIFEPDEIGIGGSFVYFKDIFLPILVEKLKKENIRTKRDEVKVKIAVLGNDAGIIGSVL